MKILLSLLFSLALSFSSFSQNGVYLFGYMENVSADSVLIDVNIYLDSSSVSTFLVADSNGNIPTQFVDFPYAASYFTIEAGFTDCSGTYNVQYWQSSEFPNLVDIDLQFVYCADSLLFGCTDPVALNYNPFATQDDGSCQYETECDLNDVTIGINTSTWGNEISWHILDSDSNIVANGGNYTSNANYEFDLCLADGCYTIEMFDTFGDGWNGAGFQIFMDSTLVQNGTLVTGSNGSISFGINEEDCSDDLTVYGCTNPTALNFNPIATIDDGSCMFTPPLTNDLCSNAVELFSGETISISNDGATLNEGIWGNCWGFGQGEGEQSSVWFTFTTPDYPASIHLEALTDGSNTLTDTQFGIFEECGGEMIYCDGNSGQNLMSALDFECGVLGENTTYILMVDGWNGDIGTCYLEYLTDSTCTPEVLGCTDPNALNYNPQATQNDGSCQYELECTDVEINFDSTFNTGFWTLTGANGTYAEGNLQNGSPLFACLVDDCYTISIEQTSTDSLEDFFYIDVFVGQQLLANAAFTGNGSLEFEIGSGCDSLDVLGCTDPSAINYNPNATINDGSCEYETECTNVEISIDATYSNGIAWVLTSTNGYISEGYLESYEAIWNCLEDACYTLSVEPVTLDSLANFGYVAVYVEPNVIASMNFTSIGTLEFEIGSGCDSLDIYGCTDPSAINYNPNATDDDGSCEYEIECDLNEIEIIIHTETWGYEISWQLLNSSNAIVASGDGYTSTSEYLSEYCLADGCYTFEMFDSYGDGWNGGIFEVFNGDELLATGTMVNGNYSTVTFGINQDDCSPVIFGCMDPEALNYNPMATEDDGSCQYPLDCEYNLVQLLIITESWASEISWNLLASDSTVVAAGNGYVNDSYYETELCLTDGCYTMEMFDSFGDGWNGSTYEIWMNNELISIGTSNSGSYSAISFGINQEGCEDETPVYGCTDPAALNFNPNATIDDGSCTYESDCEEVVFNLSNLPNEMIYYTVTSTDGYNMSSNFMGENNATLIGCLPDGCYTFEINMENLGDVVGFNVTLADTSEIIASGTLNENNLSFAFEIGAGCDSTNVIYGCTDPNAYNYNPEATEDDGSCIYEFECSINFFVIPDSTGQDVIWIVPSDNILAAAEVLWDFGDGTTSTELFPVHTYVGDGPFTLCLTATFTSPDGSSCVITYCAVLSGEMVGSGFAESEGGFTINVVNDDSAVGIEDINEISQFALWPNPTTGQLNMSFNVSNGNVSTIDIMDITGKTIMQKSISTGTGDVNSTLDVSQFRSGVYLLKVSTSNSYETQRFVIAK